MAKSMSFPFILREAVANGERLLGVRLGIPMNAKLPHLPQAIEEGEEYTLTAHFEGRRDLAVRLRAHPSDFGLSWCCTYVQYQTEEGDPILDLPALAGRCVEAGVHLDLARMETRQDKIQVILREEAIEALSSMAYRKHYREGSVGAMIHHLTKAVA